MCLLNRSEGRSWPVILASLDSTKVRKGFRGAWGAGGVWGVIHLVWIRPVPLSSSIPLALECLPLPFFNKNGVQFKLNTTQFFLLPRSERKDVVV